MTIEETTKILKQGPEGINIEPMPNPKPLAVERVTVRIQSGSTELFSQGEGFIRNAKLSPDALTGRG